MITQHNKPDTGKRQDVIGVRFTEKQRERLQAVGQHLGIPVQVPISGIIRTLALVGLESFERRHRKQHKRKGGK